MEAPYEIWLTGQAVSEEKMFKECGRRWMDNGVCLYYRLTYEPKLRWANKKPLKLISARPRSAEYMIGICFETAKNTKAFECFFFGYQRSLWIFSTTGNLYSLKSCLWLAVVACVMRWPINNALLNDIWLACFARMHNWNYWHKHPGFMVNSILGHSDHSQLAPFHWSIRSLVSSYVYCTQVNSILSIFRTFFVY